MQNRLTAFYLFFCFLPCFSVYAQTDNLQLTVEQIMQDPKWMGSSPSDLFWGADGETLYFKWNPDAGEEDSLYRVRINKQLPEKVNSNEYENIIRANDLVWNEARTAYVYAHRGDIYYKQVSKNVFIRITRTETAEQRPVFSFNEKRIVYQQQQNLFSWDIATGAIEQLTNFVKEVDKAAKPKTDPQADWLLHDQLEYFEVLRERKEKKDALKAKREAERATGLRQIPMGTAELRNLEISPDGRFISYRLRKQVTRTSTSIPDFVTESGYTQVIQGRPKVGQALAEESFYIFDALNDTIYNIDPAWFPGITDIPAYVQSYPDLYQKMKTENANRSLSYSSFSWSPDAKNAVLEIHAQDNKDRWLMLWSSVTNQLTLLDRQHDDAWIGGPGIHAGRTGWIDENQFWYQSEKTGFSHLYIYDLRKGISRAITSGEYEIQEATVSPDKKYFFAASNKVHPGEKQFYRIEIANGNQKRITQKEGAHFVHVSPSGKEIAFLYSYKNIPPELYIQKMDASSNPVQITHKGQSEAFKSYAWRDPELVEIPASDGKTIYARLYKPRVVKSEAPAVLFVHGAGYLQNAHKWWSSYFREYMFNNVLADQGYYVLDIDYRGSAGYGRDWRTGIYRHMGGKDLSDHVDAVNWLKNEYGINDKRVGMYGGSYGGFISLMALFTEPDVFAAGAALRPVTDWAQYNHGYTSNILNEPFMDSLAYRRSSPLYFAEGLKGHLLICHGMVDVNVHFQDAVKLSQRLIELQKDNWEMIGYPMEDHGFEAPSSWTDEYKRIFKLFEKVLK